MTLGGLLRRHDVTTSPWEEGEGVGDIDPQGELVSMHTNTLANLLLLTGIKDAATLFSIVLRMGVLYTYMCTLNSWVPVGI